MICRIYSSSNDRVTVGQTCSTHMEKGNTESILNWRPHRTIPWPIMRMWTGVNCPSIVSGGGLLWKPKH